MTSTAVPAFDLVAAAPALVDRRALSQAWYDALHLAERGEPRTREIRLDELEPARPGPRGRALTPSRPSLASGLRSRSAVAAARQLTAEIAADPRRERRAPPSKLARRIIAHLGATPPAAASFSLVTPRGRVHVCVRRSGGTLHLFALCRPALLAEVESALAQARFVLAGKGVRLAW